MTDKTSLSDQENDWEDNNIEPQTLAELEALLGENANVPIESLVPSTQPEGDVIRAYLHEPVFSSPLLDHIQEFYYSIDVQAMIKLQEALAAKNTNYLFGKLEELDEYWTVWWKSDVKTLTGIYLDWERLISEKTRYGNSALYPWIVSINNGSAKGRLLARLTIDMYLFFLILPSPLLKYLTVKISDGVLTIPKMSDYLELIQAPDFVWPIDTIRARGKDASDSLVLANLRLVISNARKFINRGVPVEDLIQQGNLGLMKAVQKYDPSLGFRFSTYATWWIMQSITRYIAEYSRSIRLPVHVFDKIMPIMRVRDRLHQELGREPTLQEIADSMHGLSVEKIQIILRAAYEPLSLDSSREDSDSTLAELISNNEHLDMQELTERMELRSCLNIALSQLPLRDREVLEYRFGYVDGSAKTLEDVARKYNLTRERIRQIESRALRNLRNLSRTYRLRDFLD